MGILSQAILQASSLPTTLVLFPIEMPYLIAPIVSMFSTAMVLIVGLIYKSYKAPLEAMIMWINFADFVFSLSKTVGSVFDILSPGTCLILQITSQFGMISSVFWGAFFAHALLTASYHQETQIIVKNHRAYLIFAVYLPIIMVSSLIFLRFSEYSDKMCIHKVYEDQFDYGYIFLTAVPAIISCCLSITWYLMAARRIKSMISMEGSKELLTLIVYPAILVICWLLPMTIYLCLALGCSINPIWVNIGQTMDQLQGVLDAIVYGGSKNNLRQICKCKCKVRQINSNQSSEKSLSLSESEDISKLRVPLRGSKKVSAFDRKHT